MSTDIHTHAASSQAGLASFTPRAVPQPVTIYAAVIEWPEDFEPADTALILARSDAERASMIRTEIHGMAAAMSDPDWREFSADHVYYPLNLDAWLMELGNLDNPPTITTYEREV